MSVSNCFFHGITFATDPIVTQFIKICEVSFCDMYLSLVLSKSHVSPTDA